MNSAEQARFTPPLREHAARPEASGKAKATKDAYARDVRRTAEYFDRCPDDLSAEELRTYFADLLETHSWSTIKLDRCGLQFFYRHVLDRPWDCVRSRGLKLCNLFVVFSVSRPDSDLASDWLVHPEDSAQSAGIAVIDRST